MGAVRPNNAQHPNAPEMQGRKGGVPLFSRHDTFCQGQILHAQLRGPPMQRPPSLPHQLSNSCDKKGVRPTDSHLHYMGRDIAPDRANHAHRPMSEHPAAFRRPFSVIRGFSPHPDDRRFKWMTGADRRAEQGRGGGLWAPKITRLRPVLQWARPAGRCSWWCYGLICVCLSPIFSILSFFDWLEQWMDVGLESGGG